MNKHIKALLIVPASLTCMGILSVGLAYLASHPYIGTYLVAAVLVVIAAIVIYVNVLKAIDEQEV